MMSAERLPALSLDEMVAFVDTVFPEIHHDGRSISIEAVGHGTCRVRLAYHPRHLRPGGRSPARP